MIFRRAPGGLPYPRAIPQATDLAPVPFFNNCSAPIWGRAFMAAALAPNLLIGPLSQTPEARAPLMAPRIVPPRIEQSWTQNLLASTLAPTYQQRAPLEMPEFVPARRIVNDQPNLLLSTLGLTTAPFRNPDSGLPRGWIVDRTVQGFGATVYLTANTPPLSLYDWPLPGRAPRLEQTWTQNLLQSTLTQLVYQWRGALQAPRPAAVRAIINDPPNLLASTLAPAAAAPFIPKDWPLPKMSPGLVRGEAQSIPLAIFAGIQGKPFGPSDALIRSAPRLDQSWSCNLLLTTLSGIQPVPFAQRDWQLPRAPARIDQTSAQSLLSSTLSSTPAPFAASASPIVFAAKWIDRSWTQNLVLTTLSQPIGAKSPDGPTRQAALGFSWSQNLLASTLIPMPIGAMSPPIQRAVLRSSIGEGQSPPLALLAGTVTFFYPPRIIVYPDANRIIYVGGPRINY